MKTVNVPHIDGLDNLLAVLTDAGKFKKHLAELKGALQELQEAAGGVEVLREAGTLRNRARSAMTEADAALASARKEAAEIRSQAARELEDVRVAKNALAKRTRIFKQKLTNLEQDQASFLREKGAWEEKGAARRAELEVLAAETDQGALALAEKEAIMRRRLEAANAAMDG